MSFTLTCQQVRSIDARAVGEYGMSGLVLMENAGRGCADVICRLLANLNAPHGPVAVICGRGNNGGDGLVIARHLDLRRVETKIVLLAAADDLRGDAAANLSIAKHAAIPMFEMPDLADRGPFQREIGNAALLVDAMLGTGATGEPRAPYREAIDCMNQLGKPIVAVDVPSGLDCDTGAASQATIRAVCTCTFVALKPGLLADGARQFVGKIEVLDIGAPRRLIEQVCQAAP